MPKIAGLSLMQIQLEEQERQPIKQISIESRHFLLNLQLGGLGSSQDKGQYCDINLFCLRPRRKKSILRSCWESITARDSGSPQRGFMPLSSERGEERPLWALGGGSKANLLPETCPKARAFVKHKVRPPGRWSTAWTWTFLEVSWGL